MRGSRTDTADRAGPVDPFTFEGVPLPSQPRGRTRAQQRRARRRQRRIRMLGIGAVVAVVVGAVALLVGQGGGGGDGNGSKGGGGGGPSVVPPALVALRDSVGNATSLFVLAPSATKGGTIVLIPPGTMTEVVSLGLEPVSKALQLGGPSRLQATVENLLGVGMAGTAVLDDQTLATVLGPVGPLSVDVQQRVEEVDATGRVRVAYEAGPNVIQPNQAGAFLAAKGRDTDLARLARHQKFLEAWFAAVRTRPDAAPTEPAALARAFDALTTGDIRTRVLPVEAFGTAGADGELYRVRQAELDQLVASAFPSGSTAANGPRPRIQILNGTGAIGLAEAVQRKLGPGFIVSVTGNAASFSHDDTEIVYYERDKESMARRVREALGVGTLVFSRNPIDVVDVTIVVGKDFGTS